MCVTNPSLQYPASIPKFCCFRASPSDLNNSPEIVFSFQFLVVNRDHH
jgi:hypothetical protein